MWFRNARVYRFTKPVPFDAENLEQKLQETAFKPCGPQESFRMGWVPPLGGEGPLVHQANGCLLLRLRKEERLLPAAVVKEAVVERVEMIEAEQNRKVGRKEKTELRDQLTLEMLPRAFTRSRHSHAYIVPREGYLVVDAASARPAEELTSALRTAVGSLPVRPPAVNQSPAFTFTAWLKGDAHPPAGLGIGQEAELKDSGEDGGVVRCKGLDLQGDEVRAHLENGMQATRLALDWQESLSFLIDEDLSLRRLKFGDTLKEQLESVDSDDQAARFDAAFTLMTLEIDRLLPVLLEAFGGEDRDAISSTP